MEESFVGGDGFRRVRTFVTGLLVGLGMYAQEFEFIDCCDWYTISSVTHSSRP